MTEAFLIANRDWPDETKLAAGMHTIAPTIGEAWRRHVGYNRGLDFSILVQRWNEKGYGPHRVRILLDPEPLPSIDGEAMAAFREYLSEEDAGRPALENEVKP